jgi:hypothetical protein
MMTVNDTNFGIISEKKMYGIIKFLIRLKELLKVKKVKVNKYGK